MYPSLSSIVGILCSLTATCVAAGPAADSITIASDGRPVFEYRQTPNPNKVYVSELYTPGGTQVLLDSPSDHVHHHALMLGLDVDGVSFWLDGESMGTQRPRGAATVTTNGLSQTLDWVTPDGRVLLVENREITTHSLNGSPFTLITWQSRLTPAKGVQQVSLFTTRSYSGLGLRLPKSMDRKARFIFYREAESTPVRNTEKVTWAGSVACTGPAANGKTVTVAMFSYPPHCRHITHWFTMSDSLTYMTATKNLYRQPILLRADETLEFKHGVAAWDGVVNTGTVARANGLWARKVGPPPAEGWHDTHFNVAHPIQGATATASSVYGKGYEAGKAIDGRWAVRETDKWNSRQDITPHYLKLDLGEIRTIDRIRIVHEGLLPGGEPCTTSDFRLQGSLRQWGPFRDLTPPVRNNGDAISQHVFEPRDIRYVRLLIETGEQNDSNAYGRIFEMEVYSPRRP